MNKKVKETMEEMRERLKKEKESSKKREVLPHLTHEKSGPDFAKIAEELEARKQEETKGENEGFIKDTIYIEESIYKSFNALCVRRGDKKKFANQAFAEFVEKKYREING